MALNWKQLDQAKRRGILPIRKTNAELFRRQGREVIENLAKLPRSVYASRDFHSSALFDFDFWTTETEALMYGPIREALSHGFITGALSASVDGISFFADDPRVLHTIQTINAKSKFIPVETRDSLDRLVARSTNEEWTEAELARKVQKMFKGMEFYRADRIARTSGTGGFERGQTIAFDDAGIEEREWIAQPQARPDHAAADGQVAKQGVPFDVGGESLLYPGDPSGSAGNVINCRCSQLPIAKEV